MTSNNNSNSYFICTNSSLNDPWDRNHHQSQLMYPPSHADVPDNSVSHVRPHQGTNHSLSSSLTSDRTIGGYNNEARPTRIAPLIKSKEATTGSLSSTRQSSTFKGICWNKVRQTWLVRVLYKGERVYVGNFRDEIEAAKAYDKKAIELLGSGAILNFSSSIDEFDSPAPLHEQESDNCDMVQSSEISKGKTINKKNKRKRSRDEHDNRSIASSNQLTIASPGYSNNSISKEYEKIIDNEEEDHESDSIQNAIDISPPQKKISKYFNDMVSDANPNTYVYYPYYVPSTAMFNPSFVNQRWSMIKNNNNNNAILKLVMNRNSVKESELSQSIIPLNHCNNFASGIMYSAPVKPMRVESMIGNVQFPHDINPLLMLSLVADMTSTLPMI